MAVLDDPAAARAVDRCLTARALADRRGPVTRVHPRRCAWCDYELADLQRLLEGFNAWARWDERLGKYDSHDVRVWTEWARKHPDEAEAAITAAQGLVDDPPPAPEPMTVAPSEPAHDPTPEEGSAWML